MSQSSNNLQLASCQIQETSLRFTVTDRAPSGEMGGAHNNLGCAADKSAASV